MSHSVSNKNQPPFVKGHQITFSPLSNLNVSIGDKEINK